MADNVKSLKAKAAYIHKLAMDPPRNWTPWAVVEALKLVDRAADILDNPEIAEAQAAKDATDAPF